MALSDIDICNVALYAVGAKAIQSFSEDSKSSRACQAFYGLTRDLLLEEFDWNFARKFKALTVIDLPTEEKPEIRFAYQLPADCVSPRKLWPYLQRDYWEVLGDKLYCNREEDVSLYYTSAITNSQLFSVAFANTLAGALATKLASIVAQDKALAKSLYEVHLLEKTAAFAMDANANNSYRGYDESPEADSFVNPDLQNYVNGY